MKLKCLSCQALTRPVYLCAARSPHMVDVELLQIGLHNKPLNLKTRLQERINEVANEGYDAVLLAYGLCGQATAGLKARKIPLVIPRAHDCITLFLGSRERYQEQFDDQPGTYWYVQDYIERREGSGTVLALGAGMDHTNLEALHDVYVAKYGHDNADYLMEVMGEWQNHYQRAVFIDMGVGDSKAVESETKAEASRREWEFERLTGNLMLIRRLLNGDWDNDFLVVEPGRQIVMSYGEDIVTCLIEN